MRALSFCLIATCAAVAAVLIAGVSMAYRALLFDLSVVSTLCTTSGDDAWTFDAWITLPMAIVALLYVRGGLHLRSRQAQTWRRSAGFACAMVTLALALMSPLHHWGSTFFTAHMVEHELVMAVAAPLLVWARPAAQLLWGMPAPLRHATGWLMATSSARAAWTWISAPLAATLTHGAVIWLWHVPPVFESALAMVAVHRLQHVAFLLSAIVFWWSILRRCNPGAAAAHLFFTMLHMSILGALIAVAPHVLFGVQTAGASRWGFTSLEDQQLAGIVMWIPAGTVYAGASIACFAAWLRRSGAQAWRAPHAIPPA